MELDSELPTFLEAHPAIMERFGKFWYQDEDGDSTELRYCNDQILPVEDLDQEQIRRCSASLSASVITPEATNTPDIRQFQNRPQRALLPTVLLFSRQIWVNGKPRTFLSLKYHGLFFSDNPESGFRRAAGTPLRKMPGSNQAMLYRDIRDLWSNPANPQQILAINKHDILQSDDGGASFRSIAPEIAWEELRDPLFTSLAASTTPDGKLDAIYVGTTLSGILAFQLKGNQWMKPQTITAGLPLLKHSSQITFYEEISSMIYLGDRQQLVAISRFSGYLMVLPVHNREQLPQLWRIAELISEMSESVSLTPDANKIVVLSTAGLYSIELEKILIPTSLAQRHSSEAVEGTDATKGTGEPDEISNINYANFSYSFLSTDRASGVEKISLSGLFHSRIAGYQYISLLHGSLRLSIGLPGDGDSSEDPFDRFTASPLRAIYVSPYTMLKKQGLLYSSAKNYLFNAAVIDFKDDMGRLLYGSKLPEANAMNNSRQRVPVLQTLHRLKKSRIYTIARIVSFKDPVMFHYNEGEFALKDKIENGSWVGHIEERWVNPCSSGYQDYLIRVAVEAQQLGFDEVQFDYIRFPTDGPIWKIQFPEECSANYRSEAIEALLIKARARLSIPVSIDIYGYNGIYRADGIIGQDIEDLGPLVNAVSPMHYSSHFGPQFLEHIPIPEKSYLLLLEGTRRPVLRSRGLYAIRPWIQAFQMHINRWGWGTDYMKAQIHGVLNGGGHGFMWWGPLDELALPGSVQRELFSP